MAALLPAAPIVLGAAAVRVLLGFGVRHGKGYLDLFHKLWRTEGIVFNWNDAHPSLEEDRPGVCQAIATEHCADTVRWREDLVAAAEHNLVISGGYCGGKIFERLLELIESRLRDRPHLKVVILSSPLFLKRACREKAEGLIQRHPQNVSLVRTPLVWHVWPGVKKATNHTKCVVIDYGRYFILGGSNIKDNYTGTGLDGPAKAAGSQAGWTRDAVDPGIHRRAAAAWLGESDSLVERLLPASCRDMDFVFSTTDGPGETPVSGQQVYQQMLLLAVRWERYGKRGAGKHRSPLAAKDMGAFTGRQTPIAATDTVTVQLLKTPIPPWRSITTVVRSFDVCTRKVEGVSFRLVASGPEQRRTFASELVRALDTARSRIVVNHMYFHPSREVMGALRRAARRGVEVIVISCGVYPGCPGTHYLFGPRNKYNYAALINALPERERRRVKVYEFRQRQRGHHKKVLVVDDVVLAGNSNIGYKSLVSTSDHELNFSARSPRLAEETLRVCRVDIEHSVEIRQPLTLTPREYSRAFFHRWVAPLID